MNTNIDGNGNPLNDDLEVVELDENETDIEKIKEANAKLTETNKQLFARAKKGEGFELKDGKWVKKETPAPEKKPEATKKSTESLSGMDVMAIMNAKVPTEDVNDVVEFAQYKKISVAEALQDPILKGILSQKGEERASAEATNTGSQAPSTGKLSDETLLSNAKKGILPEKPEDMTRLVKLQQAKR